MNNKPFIYLTLLLTCAYNSYAQNNTFPSYGNVGIYNTNPKSAFSENDRVPFIDNADLGLVL